MTATDVVGRSYAGPHVQVTRRAVDEFAQALGMQPGDAVPPTFAFLIASRAWRCLFDDAELDLRLERVIHGEEHCELGRPLVVGDDVQTSLQIVAARARGQARYLTVQVDLRVADELVATCRSVLVAVEETADEPR